MRPDRPMRFRMISRLAAAAAALTLSLAPAPRALAQDSVATAPAASTQAPAAAPSGAVLPGQDIEHQPRTMRAYWHVFAAFTLAWLLVFGYAISLGRRFRTLEREVDALRGTS